VDYLDQVGPEGRYGGRDLQAQSHEESVLALPSDRLRGMDRAIVLLDEPEAAPSPSRQLARLALLRDWARTKTVQAIIAAHAPILLCYPRATLYQFEAEGFVETSVEQTEHFQVTRAFLANPARYLAELFDDGDVKEPRRT
jgi:predicted ATPase